MTTADSAHSAVGDEAADALLARELYAERSDLIERYVQWLAGAGVERGLIGPRETGRLWGRHVLNSAALASLLSEGADVADVGSGAGLPGLPLAILRPDLRVTLVEPLLRRATFLEECVDDLGLVDHVAVVRSRAEALDGRVDAVVCRAVAPLKQLLGWTSHLWLPRGALIALKGARAEHEVADAARDLQRGQWTADIREVRAAPAAEPTRAVVVTRA